MVFCSCFCSKSSPSTQITLAFFGIDNSGKTTAFNTLRGEFDSVVSPTVGFDTASFTHQNTEVSIFDVGGGKKIRDIWEMYYAEVHGVVFFIDATDIDRLKDAGKALEECLSNPYLSKKPLLVLANKQDCTKSLSPSAIYTTLNLQRFSIGDFGILGATSLPFKRKPHPSLLSAIDWIVCRIVSSLDVLTVRVEKERLEFRAIQKKLREERRKRIQERMDSEGILPVSLTPNVV
ncbi:hypothetical protein RCL1_004961 [Eukaryota sp. TZLM3-RCL]